MARAEQYGVPQVVKDLGIAKSILYSWRAKQKQGNNSLKNQELQQAELAKLRRDNTRLGGEFILKKVTTYLTKESQ